MNRKQNLTKDQWVAEVYRLLTISQGSPENQSQIVNLYEWAEAMAQPDEGYYHEGLSPKEAHYEELIAKQ